MPPTFTLIYFNHTITEVTELSIYGGVSKLFIYFA